jgi:hypothetical protein
MFTSAAVLFSLATCSSLTDEGEAPGLNVLFIGNSLTYENDLPAMLRVLFDSAGLPRARVVAVAKPNFGLEDHWVGGDSHTMIARGGWDYVVLQQGPSATEGRPSLIEYSHRFEPEIRAAGAVPALYMVWPAATRPFDFDGVSDAYRTAAAEVSGVLLPAGDGWREAWALDPGLQLYGADGFHPSAAGTYLAALVMFQRFTGLSPIGLPGSLTLHSSNYPDPRIPPEIALTLQRAAAAANASLSAVR